MRRDLPKLSRGVTAYTQRGPPTAPRVVFVFGGFHFPRNCDLFLDHLAERLGDGFRVVSYDYYGRGDSADPGARYDEALYLGQARELIDALGLKGPLDVLGYSFGGNVVARFAATYPDKVASLTISGPFGAWEPFLAPARWLPRLGLSGLLYRIYWQRMREELEKGFDDPRASAELIDHMLAVELEIRDRDPEKLRRAILGTFRHFPTDTRRCIESLAGRDMPVLFASGVRDCVCPIAHLRAMHRAVPGSKLVELEGNHNDLWLVPSLRDSLASTLVAFLRER